MAGFGITPIFANKFSIAGNPHFVRITAGEFVGGDPEKDSVWHTVIAVPFADAIGLARAILAVEEKLQETAAQTQVEQGNADVGK
jgi:hypothetical protein